MLSAQTNILMKAQMKRRWKQNESDERMHAAYDNCIYVYYDRWDEIILYVVCSYIDINNRMFILSTHDFVI